MSSFWLTAGRHRIRADSRDGLTLLQLLRREGIAVQAPCGGLGKCGKCALRISEAGTVRTVRACSYIPGADCEVLLPENNTVSELSTSASMKAGDDLGAAVDIGTTTVSVSLIRLADGVFLGSVTEWNAQASFGADVISRIKACSDKEGTLAELEQTVRRQAERMILGLCEKAGADPARVVHVFAAGNTVMQHIFAGIDPQPIGVYPYTPRTLFRKSMDLFLPRLPSASVHLAPCVSGFVGGDVMAGLYAVGSDVGEETVLYLDIGTNGEIVLRHQGNYFCCSAACGPAFEGAEITCGGRSGPGAIRTVRFGPAGIEYRPVGDAPAASICGSGLIDLLAVLLRTGAVDETGRLLPPEEASGAAAQYLAEDENGNGVFLFPPDGTVKLTAGDVRKLQLAKAAVAAGIEILLREAGLAADAIDVVYIAGGFGGAVDPENAEFIGLIPHGAAKKVRAPGNASLQGAVMALRDPAAAKRMRKLGERCRCVELSGHPAFSDAFVDAMLFENGRSD